MSAQNEPAIPVWTLGDRLAKARVFADLDQRDMAVYLGMSKAVISVYERDVRPPKLPVLRDWALRCGVSLDWLLTGVGSPPNAGAPNRGSGGVSSAAGSTIWSVVTGAKRPALTPHRPVQLCPIETIRLLEPQAA